MRDRSSPLREGASPDDARLARIMAIGLPIATLLAAAVVGVAVGPSMSILVLAGGLLIGVISLMWGSLRILSGDAVLSPELEALDQAAQGIDAFAVRKKMLLRALKDLENERALGKIEAEDYAEISKTYRNELKLVLKKIDAAIAPHREKAEAVAKAYLEKAGLAETPADTGAAEANATVAGSPSEEEPLRVTCPKCHASNERDAKFCKECATKIGATSTSPKAEPEERASVEEDANAS